MDFKIKEIINYVVIWNSILWRRVFIKLMKNLQKSKSQKIQMRNEFWYYFSSVLICLHLMFYSFNLYCMWHDLLFCSYLFFILFFFFYFTIILMVLFILFILWFSFFVFFFLHSRSRRSSQDVGVLSRSTDSFGPKYPRFVVFFYT